MVTQDLQFIASLAQLLALVVLVALLARRRRSPFDSPGRPVGKRTRERQLLLEPNLDSDIKVEEFSFGFSKKVALGIPCTFSVYGSPDTNMRIEKLSAVLPPGMFLIRDMRAANVGCMYGGEFDAATLADLRVSFPAMTPANKLYFDVRYTGLVPDEFKSTPVEEKTDATMVALLQELEGEADVTTVRARLRAALEKIPTFTFAVTASGPATLTP